MTILCVVLTGCTGPFGSGAGSDTSADLVSGPVDDPVGEQSPTGTEPASFTLVATGDVLLHQDGGLARGAAVTEQTPGEVTGTDYDFRGLFAPIAAVIRDADLAICHMETPVAEPGGPYRGYPLFEVQPQIIDALADAGYDTCSTASNHSLDAGFEGLVRTLDAFDDAAVEHTGMARTVTESRTPRIYEVRGVRVGHISWTYGLNGIPLPEGQPWAVNVFDPAGPDVTGLLADAARVRQAGADVVIASVHCCEEYVHDPTSAQVDIATELLSSPDVDLVLGHHAHVVQPFEQINGKWVAYGLGNHVAEQHRDVTEDSVIARFTFTRTEHGRFVVTLAEAIPTRIDLSGSEVTVVPTDSDSGSASHADSYQRVVEILTRRDASTDGLLIPAHGR